MLKRAVWVTLALMLSVFAPGAQASAAGKETYIWACQYQSLPLFVNNDYYGLDAAAKELNVNVEKIGPQKIDLPAFIASIEQAIVKRPAGMMVVGWDPSLGVAIDKAMAAGIPVITVDADVPNSSRIAFVGTDWYELGAEQAKAVAPFLKGKTGKAAIIGIAAADNTVLAKAGYIDTLKKLAPGVTVIPQVFDSASNASTVAATISNLIRSTPDLVAVAGTDSTTGPGIATAIRETGKIGKIGGTCVDAEAEHLQGVKEGSLIAAVGQKRQFFTYYGVKMLYDFNHTPVKFTDNDKANKIYPIPSKISTGFIVATKDNVDALIAAAKARSANK